ncbi:MAG TPA: 50S ribosomal protein L25 [Flavobacteriales bacterium]|nr:50S ribosomal protein L25 [Flavobacteriales bacterium]HRE73636.1 50S ribosomal protein L25/general stress protein Ctc [Flavobacteriales bacterium]HRE95303.1 50S ribosomal protein L25/general stress protein Ctc [Flavobacteriales bacterium]HRJ36368.1 50S ribosomal protein L25/general stress protein Ctc [Flavobacteriales bacterium]HRJ37231.1 50S ribosomal protein L25/general stress protein Ctc [Flavobacteriales bacterium]
MKKVSLSGSPRANVGKKDASDLRNKGLIPCVLYGGNGQTHFSINEIALKKVIWSPDVYNVELDIAGKKTNAIVKDVQFHKVSDRLQHIDFLELVPNKPVKLKLPVRLTGSPEGVKKGGKLVQNYRKMNVMGAPEKLPEAIIVDVEKLDIGQNIRVKNISIDGLRLLETAESVVAAVETTRNVATEAKDAAAAKK